MNRSFFTGPLARVRVALLAVGVMLSPFALGLDNGQAERPDGAPTSFTEGNRPHQAATGFREGVVAVSHPLAAEVGARVLAEGGNAIDAAAAIQFALNVVEPQFSGIGGGGFMLVHLAGKDSTFIVDSREKAPAAATPDMFLGQSFANASTSGHSVGVPGTLQGVEHALKQWGTRTLADTLAPAIRLAEDGFAINRFLAESTGNVRVTFQPETRAVFRLPNGEPLPEGHRLMQPDLAKTFRLIAERSVREFYEGDIAQRIVEAQQRSRLGAAGVGRMTLADLASYDVEVRQPVEGDYRGYTVKSMPPPSSGGLSVIMMLKLLEPFPLGSGDESWGFGGRHTMHAMIEAMRLTYADRAVWMGDDDYVPVPVRGLLSECFLAARRTLIDVEVRMTTPEPADPRPCEAGSANGEPARALAPLEEEKGAHTTHFSVIDRWGNIVSYTTTIENTWGTGIMVPGYGFLLNNELTDFNFTPQYDAATGNPGANDVAPYKRPRSSMAPTIIFRDGEPLVAYGSPGGATIINTILNTTLNLIDHGMDLQRAIDAPRLSVTSPAGAVSCETGFPQSTLNYLAALGHLVPRETGTPTCNASIGSVQAVLTDLRTGLQYGGADNRREGTALGLRRPPQ
ncbi:MAG: gamma-glutamyltransferase [Aromatoleum sp.]|jgi:gamma-glutamyltranspeptidase/glutathione hydrolase|uniref:gamma-glutamyltransferase n=1 Tax=Aromatoleum sp. TaxID=2307007 RepID=UPI0028953EC5|nr:gamma-glutamyltransferase [Aromatoleum sp.]MDT3672184.1 gamma-glutamyltransferase [Aromatoleum sp.]